MVAELKEACWFKGAVELKLRGKCSLDLLVSGPSDILEELPCMFCVLLSDEKHPMDGTKDGCIGSLADILVSLAVFEDIF